MTTRAGDLSVPACVVDASVVNKLFLPEDDSDLATTLLRSIGAAVPSLRAAPDLLYLEAANALWKRVRRGLLTADAALAMVHELLTLPLQIWTALPLTEESLHLAVRHDVTAYDAAYLALSDQLAVPLVSADERFIRRAGGPNDQLVLLSSLRRQPNGNSHR